ACASSGYGSCDFLGRCLLLAQGFDGANSLGSGSSEDECSLADLRLHRTSRLGQEHLAGFEVREFLDVVSSECRAVHDPALDDECGVCLGKVTQPLRGVNDVPLDERDGGRAGELTLEGVEASFLCGNGGEFVLHHCVLGVFAEGCAQVTELLHREPAVFRQHSCGGIAELLGKFCDRGSLIRPCHGALLYDWFSAGPGTKKAPAQARGSIISAS